MHAKLTDGQRWLRAAIVTGAVILSPAFFIVLYVTSTDVVRPAFGIWAWTVPVATEGCFLLLYGLDIFLQWCGKPMGWLRFTPYPFAAASLLLNVWAYRGDLPGMLGHAVLVVAFFLPVIAGEAAVRSMSVSDDEVRYTAELADARRYALDLVRDRKGRLWRWRVPSLLKRQILRSRPPAVVASAVRDGASYGGAEKWETPVEEWVTDGLTQGVKVATAVTVRKRQIERQAAATDDATAERQDERQPVRQAKRQATASERDKARGKAARKLKAEPAISAAELAAHCGVHKRTAERWKNEMTPPHLAAVR